MLAMSAVSSVEPISVLINEVEPTPKPSSTTSTLPDQSSAASDVPSHTADASSLPLGITWDAYVESGTNSQCKSEAQIVSDFSGMKDYKIVRIYGTDCDQVSIAVREALNNGQNLMGGAYMTSAGGYSDVSTAIAAWKNAINQYAGGNWDVLQLFTVENEGVNDHELTASAVVDAINNARGQLRGLGYNGPVGAVETAPATISNPSICDASDVVMCNIHAFFDQNTKASDAGTFVMGQVNQVKAACKNKRVIVTESGWPHQGDANGAAVPSPDNQRMALDSIRANFNSDMFLFSAFDSSWKADSGSTFNTERYWGTIN
jgi:exo-beta-1,3-glucanase (GH17 family)